MRTLFLILLPLLFLLNLFVGSADIPFGEIIKVLTFTSDNDVFKIIILYNRLPQALIAVVSGAALAVSGLIMQTIFANPLAGPSVLGISSASSLGVAVVTFVFSSIWFWCRAFAADFVVGRGKKQYHAADYGNDGQLYMLVVDYCAKLFWHRGERKEFYRVDIGKFCWCGSRRYSSLFWNCCGGSVGIVLYHQTSQPSSLGRKLCAKPRVEYPSRQDLSACSVGSTDFGGNGVLRPCFVYRFGCSSCGTVANEDLKP